MDYGCSHNSRHDAGHHNSRLHSLYRFFRGLSRYFAVADFLNPGFAAFQLLFIENNIQKTGTISQ
jgi:hypothetical protein